MQTSCLIVFIVSALLLRWMAIELIAADMRTVGKTILFIALAVAARYLLGVVWTPEDMPSLWFKAVVSSWVFYTVWIEILFSPLLKTARPFAVFLLHMAVPVFAKFAFTGSLISRSWNLGSVAFWGTWAAWGLLRMSSVARRITKFGSAVLTVVAIVMYAFFLTIDVEPQVKSYAGSLNDYLRKNVVEQWEPVKRGTEKIVAAWDVLVDKDRRLTAKGQVGTGKLVASTNIKREVAKLRKDLLTTDSRTVLRKIRSFDGKIAKERGRLSALREKRGLNPERAEDIESRIAKAEERLAQFEAARAEAIAEARRDLKEIGLDLPENSPFLTVDLGALIDNAIVAKNIGFVVENLKAQVDAEKGDAEAAKRYYGAYIVMLDVHAECFRQYLATAATGIWRDGIVDVAKNAGAAKQNNETKAAAEGRSEEEKAAFLHAAGTNEKTLKAAQAYLAILQRHEEVIREKLTATEKRHEVALSFWESVDIASALGAKVLSDMADFNALLELKLPDIAYFDDAAMQEEFDAITQKFMKE